MKNTGLIVANDANKDRTKAIVGNVHRLGRPTNLIYSLYYSYVDVCQSISFHYFIVHQNKTYIRGFSMR